MEAKRAVLNINGLQGEKRNEYSSLLSKHFGVKGGIASARNKKQKKELRKLLQEIYLEIMISESAELEREEAIRAGQLED